VDGSSSTGSCDIAASVRVKIKSESNEIYSIYMLGEKSASESGTLTK
jgi:hypothetical protein